MQSDEPSHFFLLALGLVLLLFLFLFFGVKEFPRCIPESTHVYVTSFQTSFTRTREQYKVKAFTSSSLRDPKISTLYSSRCIYFTILFQILASPLPSFFLSTSPLSPRPPTNYFLSFYLSPHYFFSFLSLSFFLFSSAAGPFSLISN